MVGGGVYDGVTVATAGVRRHGRVCDHLSWYVVVVVVMEAIDVISKRICSAAVCSAALLVLSQMCSIGKDSLNTVDTDAPPPTPSFTSHRFDQQADTSSNQPQLILCV